MKNARGLVINNSLHKIIIYLHVRGEFSDGCLDCQTPTANAHL